MPVAVEYSRMSVLGLVTLGRAQLAQLEPHVVASWDAKVEAVRTLHGVLTELRARSIDGQLRLV